MLEKIIRKYYDEIFCYCYHHVESPALAEDLCQDTFVSFIGTVQVLNISKPLFSEYKSKAVTKQLL